MNVKKILKKYEKELKTTNLNSIGSYDVMLMEKWRHRVPKGWYGFDGINVVWGKIIDEFLDELVVVCPKLEIHQIKLKFGGLRFYVDAVGADKKTIKKIDKEISILESALFDNSLLY